MSRILDQYRARHARSHELGQRAERVLPGGLSTDARRQPPFPTYVERGIRARKRDVDGNEVVDYWMGNGALILGHDDPAIVAAVQEQAARLLHPGTNHELLVRWAELIVDLIPSAELVRFTGSGTEATHLAIRLARAHTGRTRVVKFDAHYHGWHDGVALGVFPPYALPFSRGIPAAVTGDLVSLAQGDIEAVRKEVAAGDVAAIILEPTGAKGGLFPLGADFLRQLRELSRAHGVVLVFDEVITGFRHAPGGVQAETGVIPDLTTLGKIVAGALPGGAVCGSREIMSLLAFRNDPEWDRKQRVDHRGTFSGNPLSAAAGIAMLERMAGGAVQEACTRTADHVRERIRAAAAATGSPVEAYGDSSIVQIAFFGLPPGRPLRMDLYHLMRCALLNHGVDCGYQGFVSTAHDERDLDATAVAFERAFADMAAERCFD